MAQKANQVLGWFKRQNQAQNAFYGSKHKSGFMVLLKAQGNIAQNGTFCGFFKRRNQAQKAKKIL